MQSRYLSAFTRSRPTLVRRVNRFFSDLDATPDIRVNQAMCLREAEALITQNYEFNLSVKWEHPSPNPVLVIFDIDSESDIGISQLDSLVVQSAAPYFSELVLVYHSSGRVQNLETFPWLFDFENVVRELIISVMLSTYGPNWWNSANIVQRLIDKAQRHRENEVNLLHDHFEFHPVFYLDLADLRTIIESEETRTCTPPPPLPPPPAVPPPPPPSDGTFSLVFRNYDRVDMPGKMSEIRELRNRVMHGRYLTESNIRTIQTICEQFDRFLVRQNHVGDFDDRVLRPSADQ